MEEGKLVSKMKSSGSSGGASLEFSFLLVEGAEGGFNVEKLLLLRVGGPKLKDCNGGRYVEL